MIEYISYESVNGVPFGATEEEVVEVFGEPDNIDTKNSGIRILHYDHYGVNFNKKGEFFYIGITPREKVIINGLPAGWTLEKVEHIIRTDSSPVVDDAYIILRGLGIAFINFHNIKDDDMSEKVIAFFAKDEMEAYDTEKPFELIDDARNSYNRLKILD